MPNTSFELQKKMKVIMHKIKENAGSVSLRSQNNSKVRYPLNDLYKDVTGVSINKQHKIIKQKDSQIKTMSLKRNFTLSKRSFSM